ncbi:unnamed protein product [Effrenium voratum]|nr:unnamed protein product [Effrenium voratum]
MTEVWSSSTHLERTSWHYVLYPVALLGITITLLLRPSSICRIRYKMQLLGGLGRTCLAPFYAVHFGDNMIGDVLTSLARPLRDVPAAICYLSLLMASKLCGLFVSCHVFQGIYFPLGL